MTESTLSKQGKKKVLISSYNQIFLLKRTLIYYTMFVIILLFFIIINVLLVVIIFKTVQRNQTPARTGLRSSKKQDSFTSIQDTPRGTF